MLTPAQALEAASETTVAALATTAGEGSAVWEEAAAAAAGVEAEGEETREAEAGRTRQAVLDCDEAADELSADGTALLLVWMTEAAAAMADEMSRVTATADDDESAGTAARETAAEAADSTADDETTTTVAEGDPGIVVAVETMALLASAFAVAWTLEAEPADDPAEAVLVAMAASDVTADEPVTAANDDEPAADERPDASAADALVTTSVAKLANWVLIASGIDRAALQ